MSVIELGNVIDGGGGSGGILTVAGAPVAGTTEIQTLTLGGTPTGGSFTLTHETSTTAAIPWAAVNATLLASINAALDAVFGSAQIVATAGTLTAGIGTILLTFSGSNYAKRAVATMTVTSALTGTSPTAAIAETTPGVTATGRSAAKGTLLIDTTTPKLYQNTGSAQNPTWQAVGAQS
jgi:hypothetical protein